MSVTNRMDAMRQFVIEYPRWDEYGIAPMRGKFGDDFSKISVGWFQSATNISQLALEFTGSTIVQKSSDPIGLNTISGHKIITRQANFALYVAQSSSTVNERAKTSEFLLDFIEWVDERNHAREIPIFGSEPNEEQTWASNGSFLADFEDEKTKRVSTYLIQLHKIYVQTHNPIF